MRKALWLSLAVLGTLAIASPPAAQGDPTWTEPFELKLEQSK